MSNRNSFGIDAFYFEAMAFQAERAIREIRHSFTLNEPFAIDGAYRDGWKSSRLTADMEIVCPYSDYHRRNSWWRGREDAFSELVRTNPDAMARVAAEGRATADDTFARNPYVAPVFREAWQSGRDCGVYEKEGGHHFENEGYKASLLAKCPYSFNAQCAAWNKGHERRIKEARDKRAASARTEAEGYAAGLFTNSNPYLDPFHREAWERGHKRWRMGKFRIPHAGIETLSFVSVDARNAFLRTPLPNVPPKPPEPKPAAAMPTYMTSVHALIKDIRDGKYPGLWLNAYSHSLNKSSIELLVEQKL